MRIIDWSSDVSSSDLASRVGRFHGQRARDMIERHRNRKDMLPALAQVPRLFGVALPLVAVDVEHGRFLAQRHQTHLGKIGRASRRERVCPYVKISVVAVQVKKKRHKK